MHQRPMVPDHDIQDEENPSSHYRPHDMRSAVQERDISMFTPKYQASRIIYICVTIFFRYIARKTLQPEMRLFSTCTTRGEGRGTASATMDKKS